MITLLTICYRFWNIYNVPIINWASQLAQWVKNLPTMQEMQETWVWSLGQEDPLQLKVATQSSILAWKIPWTEEPGRLQSTGSQSWTWLSYWAQSLYTDLVCRDVLSTKYSEGASSYAEHSEPLSLVNETNKKLKYTLGSWEIPSKEVTFTTKPEGWMPDSHCSVFLWLWKSQGFVCQPQSCIEDALLPASSRCVTAGGADPEVTCWVLL